MAKFSSSGDVTLLLYISGEVLEGGVNGVYYSTGPAKAIRVCKTSKFNQLHHKICQSLDIKADVFAARLTCRYPVFTDNGRVNFVALPLFDDEDVCIVLDCQATCQVIHAIELYLTLEPRETTRNCTFVDTGNLSSVTCHNAKGLSPDGCGELHADVNYDRLYEQNVTAFDNVTQVIAADASVSPSPETPSKNFDEERTVPERQNGKPILGDCTAKTCIRDGIYASQPDDGKVSTKPIDNSAECKELDDFGELHRGMVFTSKQELKNAVQNYNVQRNRQFNVLESNRTIWVAKCTMDSECGWRLRACKRRKPDQFEITKYVGPHICVGPSLSQDHLNLDSAFIAKEVGDMIKHDPSVPIANLQDFLKTRFGHTLSYKKVWLAKQKVLARGQLSGNPENSSILDQ